MARAKRAWSSTVILGGPTVRIADRCISLDTYTAMLGTNTSAKRAGNQHVVPCGGRGGVPEALDNQIDSADATELLTIWTALDVTGRHELLAVAQRLAVRSAEPLCDERAAEDRPLRRALPTIPDST